MGPALIGDRQPDAHRVDRETYINFVRHAWWNGVPEQHWSAEQYRANLLQRIGPKNLIATYKQAIEPDVKRAEAALHHMARQMPPMPQMMGMGMPLSPAGPPPGMGMSPPMPMTPMGGGPASRPMLMPPRPGGM